ncbi:hypothetical protein T492DRAFT_1066768 [Pavlovales sp. CCMP2436]|nr:hypothetical protein T492DRAFT_1066768 [Pavlovales sp. CCMP2436]
MATAATACAEMAARLLGLSARTRLGSPQALFRALGAALCVVRAVVGADPTPNSLPARSPLPPPSRPWPADPLQHDSSPSGSCCPPSGTGRRCGRSSARPEAFALAGWPSRSPSPRTPSPKARSLPLEYTELLPGSPAPARPRESLGPQLSASPS